jgi:hypothetical protein
MDTTYSRHKLFDAQNDPEFAISLTSEDMQSIMLGQLHTQYHCVAMKDAFRAFNHIRRRGRQLFDLRNICDAISYPPLRISLSGAYATLHPFFLPPQ